MSNTNVTGNGRNLRMQANVLQYLSDNLFNGQRPATVGRKELAAFFDAHNGNMGPFGSEVHFPQWIVKCRTARTDGKRGTQRGVYALPWEVIDQYLEVRAAQQAASTTAPQA